jgi:hypothetical protein
MKIGFFGDSFCEEFNNPHSIINGYETYLTKVKNHYSADIVNLGKGGSSVWDVILKQFPSVETPDVCIFCWTDRNRIYHPTVRNLSYGNTVNLKLKDIKLSNIFNYKTVDAAKKYFQFLYDDNKAKEEIASALYKFDREILAKLTGTKIIHLWCFDNIYEWQTGQVIPVILKDFAAGGSDMAPNHIDGLLKNQELADLIIKFIDAT